MANVKIRPSFWEHSHCVPLSRDLAPASIFDKHRDYLVFDLETTELIRDDLPIEQMQVSVLCAWDSAEKRMLTFYAEQIKDFISLCRKRLVVGYNIRGFDLRVLQGYGLKREGLDVFDLMDEARRGTGQRYVKLAHVAQGTLGNIGKSADGVQAVEWYKEGRMEEIAKYCAQDVEVTHQVFRHGLDKGFLAVQREADGPKTEFSTDWT